MRDWQTFEEWLDCEDFKGSFDEFNFSRLNEDGDLVELMKMSFEAGALNAELLISSKDTQHIRANELYGEE